MDKFHRSIEFDDILLRKKIKIKCLFKILFLCTDSWYVVNFNLVLFILLSRFFLNYSYYTAFTAKITPCMACLLFYSASKNVLLSYHYLRKHCKVISRNARGRRYRAGACICVYMRNLRETRYKQRFQSGLRAHFELSIALQDRRAPASEKGRYFFFSLSFHPLLIRSFSAAASRFYRTKTPLPCHPVLSTGIFSAQLVMLVTGARTVKSCARSHDKLPRILTARSPHRN